LIWMSRGLLTRFYQCRLNRRFSLNTDNLHVCF